MNVLLIVYPQIFLDLRLQIFYIFLTGELTWIIDFFLEYSYYIQNKSKLLNSVKECTGEYLLLQITNLC